MGISKDAEESWFPGNIPPPVPLPHQDVDMLRVLRRLTGVKAEGEEGEESEGPQPDTKQEQPRTILVFSAAHCKGKERRCLNT